MSSISNDQKQLLFDFSLGLTSETESERARELIASNAAAATIYEDLQATFMPLECFEHEPCPEDLAERVISRLMSHANNSGHQGLEELLADEQSRPVIIKVGFWRNLTEMVAVAAVLMIIAGVLLPMLGRERQRYWKTRCGNQLSSIFGGFRNYLSDHDQKAPIVPAKEGRQWNTQGLYLLVKSGYLKEPAVFICPGRKQGKVASFDLSKAVQYTDFPVRAYITYSPRARCPKTLNKSGLCEGPILSDRNPMFDDLVANAFKKRLDRATLNANSRNHRGKGQNLLYDDGSVRFTTRRTIGAAKDDIFSMEGMCCGTKVGEREVLPFCITDIFLAP